MDRASRRVLTIDDSKETTRLLSSRLSARGYDMYDLNDPRQAMEFIRVKAIEVVLLDIEMPDVSGLEVLKQIRSSGLSVSVIMVTGYVDFMNRVRAFRWGADFMAAKPVDFDRLELLIDHCLFRLDEWKRVIKDVKTAPRETEIEPLKPLTPRAVSNDPFELHGVP